MCLLLTDDPTRHVLTEDRVVYKILLRNKQTGVLLSPFRYIRYEIGKLNESHLDYPRKAGMVMIVDGMESYREGQGRVSRGLHGYLTPEDAYKSYLLDGRNRDNRFENLMVFKARVPAGSEIYYGLFEDCGASFAASKLIVDGPL